MRFKQRYLALAVCGLAVLAYTPRFVLSNWADRVSNGFLRNQGHIAKGGLDDRQLMALTKLIFNRYADRRRPETQPLLLRLRPYLSNRRLPGWLRVPPGALEVIYSDGWCDDAARALAYVLESVGAKAFQLNIATPTQGHSVLLVTLPKREPGRGQVLVDPLFGVVAADSTGLISPDAARRMLQQGNPVRAVFKPVAKRGDTRFYREFADSVFGVQGQGLEIESHVPAFSGPRKAFGRIDGSSQDVSGASMRAGMTPYWHYLGHRYDRSWVRSLEASERLRVTFVLADEPNESFFTSDVPPRIAGKKLVWELDRGQKLIFRDGRARPSFLRFTSYQPIDQIIFEKLASPVTPERP